MSRLLTGALMLLVAAWAVSEAIRLITGVWVPLLIICAVVAVASGTVVWWRSRRHGGW